MTSSEPQTMRDVLMQLIDANAGLTLNGIEEAWDAMDAIEREAQGIPLIDVELLATLEHEQWATWARTVLRSEPGISEARRTRWERLIATHYADLTEAEKHEDRMWAEKVLAAIGGLDG